MLLFNVLHVSASDSNKYYYYYKSVKKTMVMFFASCRKGFFFFVVVVFIFSTWHKGQVLLFSFFSLIKEKITENHN